MLKNISDMYPFPGGRDGEGLLLFCDRGKGLFLFDFFLCDEAGLFLLDLLVEGFRAAFLRALGDEPARDGLPKKARPELLRGHGRPPRRRAISSRMRSMS